MEELADYMKENELDEEFLKVKYSIILLSVLFCCFCNGEQLTSSSNIHCFEMYDKEFQFDFNSRLHHMSYHPVSWGMNLPKLFHEVKRDYEDFSEQITGNTHTNTNLER